MFKDIDEEVRNIYNSEVARANRRAIAHARREQLARLGCKECWNCGGAIFIEAERCPICWCLQLSGNEEDNDNA